jgi:hypothetical protein
MQLQPESTVKFGEKEYLSYSSLKLALRSPQHFWDYVTGAKVPSGDALDFGSGYDAMLFDSANFDKQFYVVKESEIIERLIAGGAKSPRSTKEYKEYMAAESEKASGRTVLTESDYNEMCAMLSVIRAAGLDKSHLVGGQQIKSSVELEGPHKIKLHGVADIFFPFQRIVRDFKTTGEDIDRFKYSAYKYHYDLQAYVYKILFNYDVYEFVVQETKYPYTVGVFEVTDEFLMRGKDKFDQALATVIHYFVDKKADPASFIYRGIL